jgi:hypothetical protein
VVEVIYTIEDATEDSDRRVNGTIVLTVSDVPDQVQKPTVPGQGDEGTVTIGFIAPASNGKPITGYEVTSSPGASMPSGCAPPSCTITGLNNGTAYTFSVRAINEHGPGPWSTPSNPVIPYGTPGTPAPAGTASSRWAPANVTWNWEEVGANGGTVTYHWTTSSGKSGTGRPAADNGLGAGRHTITVWAVNTGGKESARATSQPVVIENQTVPGAVPNVRGTGGAQGPTTINWSWGMPGGGAEVTDNLQFRYRVSGQSASGWIDKSNRSHNTNVGQGGGDFTIEVQARNNAGEGPWSASGNVHVDAKPADPAVTRVYPTPGSGPTTRDGITNTYMVSFDVANFTPGTYSVTPQVRKDGNWVNVAGSYNTSVPPNGRADIPYGFIQRPWSQISGIRVVISGWGTSDSYGWN